MLIFELFEARPALKTVVILPGGFHPFHPGHLSLYHSAQKAFPGADIYYAATNDKTNRPFDIADKSKLAQIAGVPAGRFVQVKSPFQAKEITSNYDPNNTVLVFARSIKDRDEPPHAGGVKKNGEPAYLQPYSKNSAPMSQHGYMAYLPTVEFNAGPSGITSATQIRSIWPKASPKQRAEIIADLYPADPKAAYQILDKYLGEDANAYNGMTSVDSTSPLSGPKKKSWADYGISNDKEVKRKEKRFHGWDEYDEYSHEKDHSSLGETIRKVSGGYRLVSRKGKNLGTYPSKAGAEKRERQVQYFKHKGN